MSEYRGRHRRPEPGSGRHHKADGIPMWPIADPEKRTGESKHGKQDSAPGDSGK